MSIKELWIAAMGTVLLVILIPSGMIWVSLYYAAPFLPYDFITRFFAAIASALGVYLMAWSVYTLLHHGQGGLANYGIIKLSDKTKRLVTSGPYAICRNPMHLGLVLYYLGLTCAINSLYCLIFTGLVALMAYLTAIFFEERRLHTDFGQEYEEYARHTPRFWPSNFKRKEQ